MSAHAFPFQGGQPHIPLTVCWPRLIDPPAVTVRKTFLVDTGFSDYLQLDWDTYTALRLDVFAQGEITSELANGSVVTDHLSLVRVLIPECTIDKIVRCISNPGYGEDLLLIGSRFLEECHAIIDYPQRLTTLST